LRIDFDDLDEEIRGQNEKIHRMRTDSPEVDKCISKLESNVRLSEKENENLIKQVEELLGETGD